MPEEKHENKDDAEILKEYHVRLEDHHEQLKDHHERLERMEKHFGFDRKEEERNPKEPDYRRPRH